MAEAKPLRLSGIDFREWAPRILDDEFASYNYNQSLEMHIMTIPLRFVKDLGEDSKVFIVTVLD
jgi:hypothetical protein